MFKLQVNFLLFLIHVAAYCQSLHDIETELTARIITKIQLNQKRIISKHHVNKKTQCFTDNKVFSPITVVIDPGHGGHDKGSFNKIAHLKEKDITLQISKKLQIDINRLPKFQAFLTRQSDIYVPLRERLKVAKMHQADLFLSVHADSFIHSHARGASVFTLSLKGATSEAAKWIAEQENYSELGGTSLKAQDTLLRAVLINLSQTVTMTRSFTAAQCILKELGKTIFLHQNTVEKGGFVVLKSPDVPSVLIEVGFLSNSLEAYRLNDPTYQAHLSKAITKGVYTYFTTCKNRVTTSL